MTDNFGSAWPYGSCRHEAKVGEPEPNALPCGFPLRSDGSCPNAHNHTED